MTTNLIEQLETTIPVLISAPSPKDPVIGLNEFVRNSGLHETQQHVIWWIDCVNSGNPIWKGNEGSELLSAYGDIYRLMESAWMIHRMHSDNKPHINPPNLSFEDFLINTNTSRKSKPKWDWFQWTLKRVTIIHN